MGTNVESTWKGEHMERTEHRMSLSDG